MSTSRAYAAHHGAEMGPEGTDWPVIEKVVHAAHLFTEAEEFCEYGYDPGPDDEPGTTVNAVSISTCPGTADLRESTSPQRYVDETFTPPSVDGSVHLRATPQATQHPLARGPIAR